ncbi:MAG: HAD family hydrolase [Ktedonobacteraceae bacterium]|nr:HAD family hydrolase [Ktedonobacteraceae bacterium]
MDIQAILFDVNGTLIDIETDEGLEEIYRAIGHFLAYQGILLHRWEVRDLYFQIMQRQRKESNEVFPEWDAVELWRELLHSKASDYTRSLPQKKLEQLPLFLAELHRGIARKRLRPYPQVQETLTSLQPRYRMAVVSDAQSTYAIPELQSVGLVDYFNPIIVSGNYGYRKPDPRLFQKALDTLQVKPEQALFVGNDLYHDIFGAQQVGMKAILVSFDQGSISNQVITPDYTIFRFADLPQAINHFVQE